MPLHRWLRGIARVARRRANRLILLGPRSSRSHLCSRHLAIRGPGRYHLDGSAQISAYDIEPGRQDYSIGAVVLPSQSWHSPVLAPGPPIHLRLRAGHLSTVEAYGLPSPKHQVRGLPLKQNFQFAESRLAHPR